MRDIISGSLIIFIFKIFGAASIFIIHILISRYYGVEVLGIYNLILSLLLITSMISRVGLDIYIIKIINLLENKHDDISAFLKKVFTIVVFTSIFISFSIFISVGFIDEYLFKSINAYNYLIWLSIIIVPYSLYSIMPEVFRGFHEVKKYSFFKNLSVHMLVAIFLAVNIFFNKQYDPIYLLYVAISIITIILIIMLSSFLKKQKINILINKKYNDQIIKYSFPMLLTSSMLFLMGNVDIFMISYYLDEYQVGLYSACIKISLLITFVLASVNGYIAPKLAKAYAQRDSKELKALYSKSVKLIMMSTTPIFIFIFIFADNLLGVFGNEFKVAVTTLFIINISYLINALCGSVGYVLNMTNNQYIFMQILIIGLSINIILNIVLIPVFEIKGAAIATLVSMAFWNISSYSVLKYKNII